MDKDLLSDEEMAELLGIGVSELRKKISRGEALPPNCKLPGLRKRIWFSDSFIEWLKSYETHALNSGADAETFDEIWREYK